MTRFHRPSHDTPHDEQPLVFAVTHCHPLRIVLYAAAFQAGWKVHFMESLRAVLEAPSAERPVAVFYDQASGDPAWRRYCSALSRKGVPFVSLAHKHNDETFFALLAAGGYPAWGESLTSEEILSAVDFAEQVAGLAGVPQSTR